MELKDLPWKTLVVILCDSYKEATRVFNTFIDVLELNNPEYIRKKFMSSLCVELRDDLRYIFVDYRLNDVLHKMAIDIMDEGEFILGLEEHYEWSF